MRRLFPAALFLVFIPLHVGPAATRTFYVSPSGSDAAAGTSSHPWLTLHRAGSAPAGSRIVVRAGRYSDVFASHHALTWTAKGTVTVSGEVITTAPSSFAGFHFSGGDKRPYVLQVMGGGDVTRCMFTGGTEGLVEGRGAFSIAHSTLTAPATSKAAVLLLIQDPTTASVTSNTLTEQATASSDGIDVESAGVRARKIAISGNTIRSRARGGHVIAVGTEISSAYDNDLNGAVIEKNTINGPFSFQPSLPASAVTTHAIFVGYNRNATIDDNAVTGEGYGVVVKGAGGSYSSGGIKNNTLVNDDAAAAVTVKGVRRVPVTGNKIKSKGTRLPEAFDVVNNPESDNAPASHTTITGNQVCTDGTGPIWYIDTASAAGLKSGNNVVSEKVLGDIGRIGAKGYTVSQWQHAGYDQNSTFSADPCP